MRRPGDDVEMLGYIVTEPDLRVERVPEHLLERQQLLWPASRNALPESPSGERTGAIKPDELYHRHRVNTASGPMLVWTQGDLEQIPAHVAACINQLAAETPTGPQPSSASP